MNASDEGTCSLSTRGFSSEELATVSALESLFEGVRGGPGSSLVPLLLAILTPHRFRYSHAATNPGSNFSPLSSTNPNSRETLAQCSAGESAAEHPWRRMLHIYKGRRIDALMKKWGKIFSSFSFLSVSLGGRKEFWAQEIWKTNAFRVALTGRK